MSRSPTWRYHAAKRRQEQKLRDLATMYGANPDSIVTTDKIVYTHADYSAIEARILAHMFMSRDRVRFTIDTYTDSATRSAFHAAFGAHLPARTGPVTTVEVICRPSQFARFLIFRNDNGGKNSFKELKPELFTPESSNQPIDVSRNPAS